MSAMSACASRSGIASNTLQPRSAMALRLDARPRVNAPATGTPRSCHTRSRSLPITPAPRTPTRLWFVSAGMGSVVLVGGGMSAPAETGRRTVRAGEPRHGLAAAAGHPVHVGDVAVLGVHFGEVAAVQ